MAADTHQFGPSLLVLEATLSIVGASLEHSWQQFLGVKEDF
jgi:hypothetical protein